MSDKGGGTVNYGSYLLSRCVYISCMCGVTKLGQKKERCGRNHQIGIQRNSMVSKSV